MTGMTGRTGPTGATGPASIGIVNLYKSVFSGESAFLGSMEQFGNDGGAVNVSTPYAFSVETQSWDNITRITAGMTGPTGAIGAIPSNIVASSVAISDSNNPTLASKLQLQLPTIASGSFSSIEFKKSGTSLSSAFGNGDIRMKVSTDS